MGANSARHAVRRAGLRWILRGDSAAGGLSSGVGITPRRRVQRPDHRPPPFAAADSSAAPGECASPSSCDCAAVDRRRRGRHGARGLPGRAYNRTLRSPFSGPPPTASQARTVVIRLGFGIHGLPHNVGHVRLAQSAERAAAADVDHLGPGQRLARSMRPAASTAGAELPASATNTANATSPSMPTNQPCA